MKTKPLPRRPVSTVRDYRPPTAKASSPLERPPARPGAAAWRESTVERDPAAPVHDTYVRELPKGTLIAVAKDLAKVSVPGRPDWKTEEGQEQQWVLGRRAAALREINRRRLTPNDCLA